MIFVISPSTFFHCEYFFSLYIYIFLKNLIMIFFNLFNKVLNTLLWCIFVGFVPSIDISLKIVQEFQLVDNFCWINLMLYLLFNNLTRIIIMNLVIIIMVGAMNIIHQTILHYCMTTLFFIRSSSGEHS